MLRIPPLFVSVCLALGLAAPVQGQAAPTVRVSEFSGKAVPRFESLRYAAVRGREGPNTDHRVVWLYERAGLPVLIIKETWGWRQVRDPDGDVVWIAETQLSSRPSALVRGEAQQSLRRRPTEDAALLARVAPGVIVTLDVCEDAWCRVEVDGRRGWMLKAALWGADPLEAAL